MMCEFCGKETPVGLFNCAGVEYCLECSMVLSPANLRGQHLRSVSPKPAEDRDSVAEAITLLQNQGYLILTPGDQEEMQNIYDTDKDIFIGDLSFYFCLTDDSDEKEE